MLSSKVKYKKFGSNFDIFASIWLRLSNSAFVPLDTSESTGEGATPRRGTLGSSSRKCQVLWTQELTSVSLGTKFFM